MDAEEALRFVNELLSQQGKRLTDLQRFVFLGTWVGKDYQTIHREHSDRCSLDHLKRNVAYQLWKLLSEVFDEKVSKSTLQNCVHRALQKWQQPEAPLYSLPQPELLPTAPLYSVPQPEPRHSIEDWGDAPSATSFYGYAQLLNSLNHVIRVNLCRLISLYGISGVGKTTIALQLALQVREQYEFVIWRSLQQAPLLADLLAELTYHLSHQQERSVDLSHFMRYITEHRCLVILDGLEAVLNPGVHDGSYRAGYEAYGALLRQVGATAHESCLIITTQENPREIVEAEGNHGYVHSEVIKGLSVSGTKQLLMDKRCSGKDNQWREMTYRYWAHPFILSAIATDIREFCKGDTALFLEQFKDPLALIPDSMRSRLEQQLERLSPAEHQIVSYLLTCEEPVSLSELQQATGQRMSAGELMNVLRSLKRRAFIDTDEKCYFLQRLVMQYLQQSNP
ncbi:NACHT domain-containing protein [Oscillatoria sp. FACHB-1407]|uniref:NACHT domain-containing protein n=1 Tax=Oscillatoria sp. FACHB-1407 TaxID=2692847 RepID=UPI0016838D5A|nr:NACHT domain-containing protein [Oscillatoria sp. FACHB-1407]MBD2461850.1 NACHT domain-containing protein [Oscillatoria sp. FACHB-1407]